MLHYNKSLSQKDINYIYREKYCIDKNKYDKNSKKNIFNRVVLFIIIYDNKPF